MWVGFIVVMIVSRGEVDDDVDWTWVDGYRQCDDLRAIYADTGGRLMCITSLDKKLVCWDCWVY